MTPRRIAAGILTLGGVAVLCTLGTWQAQRLEWKEGIIARLDAARQSPQILSFPDLKALGAEDLPLAYGSVRGTLLSDREILVGPKTNEDGIVGYHLVTPLKMAGGTVLVDRGWVDDASRDPGQRTHLRSPVPVTFTGIVRKPDYSRFASGNNPAGDQWMRIDVAQIETVKKLDETAPLLMYAESADRKFDAARMNPPGWTPRNNHRQYAVFWYGMAAALAGFYAVFTWRNKKAAH